MKHINLENIELAKNLNKERNKIKENNATLDSLKNQYEIMKDDYKLNNSNRINNEKKQILDSLTCLSEEVIYWFKYLFKQLEYLSDKNKILEEKATKNNKVAEMIKQIDLLRTENDELKGAIKLREEFNEYNQRHNEY